MYWAGRINEIPKKSSLHLELTETLKPLIESGKKVYLVDDVPHFPFSPERCKFVYGNFEKSVCTTDIKSTLDDEKKYESELQITLRQLPAVKFISLRNIFCDRSSCSMVRNHELMYRDRNHLNILGSRFIGVEILKQYPELN